MKNLNEALLLAAIFTCCKAAVLNKGFEDSHVKELKNKVQASPTFKLGCILEHCVEKFVACGLSKLCREGVSCSEGCFEEWDKDTSLQKFIVQNCTNKCAFTFEQNSAFKGLVACLTDNLCWSFPKIPSTCKAPNVKPVKQLAEPDIEGHWWVIRGYHPVYDCWPCQQLEFEPINKTFWSYVPRYETYMVNGSLHFVTDQKWVMPLVAPGEKISFSYYDIGMDHYEIWWLIDKADDGSYVQMYYCGNTLQWNYEGALVFARNRTLTTADFTKIAASYQQAVGIDLKNFCFTDTSQSCPK